MLCTEVVAYLRDVVRTGPTTPLAVRPADLSRPPYGTIGRLLMEIRAAEVGNTGSRIGFISPNQPDAPQNPP
jgi:hypothetical protein